MRHLFSEIRRRRVLGTAAIYLAGAWAALQVCDVVFPILELPEQAMSIAFWVLIAGFPMVLVASWLFDIEVRRTRDAAAEADAEVDAAEAPATETVSVVPDVVAPPGSIAVLPFRNMGADPDQEYFSDGLAEELLHMLGGVPGIKVAARTSCFIYKGRDVDVRTIGAQLGVRTVLEGSVRWAGKRIRVTAQLVEAKTGYHLLSRTFDKLIEDVFALQDEIAGAIVDVLRQRLGPDSQLAAPSAGQPTTNVEAYQAYLRGRHRWQRRGAEAIGAAIALYERAIELDPRFARAKSALAAARAVMHEYTAEAREEAFETARGLAFEAMAIDPRLAEPHAVLGYIALRLWRWQEAEERLIEAISLDPNDPLFHQWYSNVLNDLGRQDDALAEALKAYELDRVAPMANNVLAVCYTLQGLDVPAEQHTRIALEFGVAGLVPALIGYLAALRRHDYTAAARDGAAAMERAGFDCAWVAPVVRALRAAALARGEVTPSADAPGADKATAAADAPPLDTALAALAAVETSGGTPANILFLQYVLLEAGDPAFALAQRLLEGQRLNHAWLMLPEAAALRADPRFDALMEQIGLSAYWREHGRPVLPSRPAPAAGRRPPTRAGI